MREEVDYYLLHVLRSVTCIAIIKNILSNISPLTKTLSLGLQLVRRVYKGIPDRLRGEVWSRLLSVNKIKAEQEGIYQVRIKDLIGTTKAL